jgi:N-methylhydantoinase A/oxoprolinase/acetone carboxylase beta subunit
MRAAGAHSCEVCLLFPFMDDRHERLVAEALAREGGEALMVSLSSQVQPEFRFPDARTDVDARDKRRQARA